MQRDNFKPTFGFESGPPLLPFHGADRPLFAETAVGITFRQNIFFDQSAMNTENPLLSVEEGSLFTLVVLQPIFAN